MGTLLAPLTPVPVAPRVAQWHQEKAEHSTLLPLSHARDLAPLKPARARMVYLVAVISTTIVVLHAPLALDRMALELGTGDRRLTTVPLLCRVAPLAPHKHAHATTAISLVVINTPLALSRRVIVMALMGQLWHMGAANFTILHLLCLVGDHVPHRQERAQTVHLVAVMRTNTPPVLLPLVLAQALTVPPLQTDKAKHTTPPLLLVAMAPALPNFARARMVH